MIVRSLVTGPFQENSYIIGSRTTQKAVAVDPGGDIDALIALAQEEGLTIEKILNTHGHIDHTAGVKELQERLSIPFYLHEQDEEFLKSIPEQAELFGMQTWGIPRLNGYLRDGDTVSVGDKTLTVFHTPGHSPGGVSFLAGDIVLVGDTLFAGSIGRTDLPGGNYDRLITSIHTKLLVLDGATEAYCGHGPPTTIGSEKKTNPFLNLS